MGQFWKAQKSERSDFRRLLYLLSGTRLTSVSGCVVGMGVADQLPADHDGLVGLQEVQCLPHEQVCPSACPLRICSHFTR